MMPSLREDIAFQLQQLSTNLRFFCSDRREGNDICRGSWQAKVGDIRFTIVNADSQCLMTFSHRESIIALCADSVFSPLDYSHVTSITGVPSVLKTLISQINFALVGHEINHTDFFHPLTP